MTAQSRRRQPAPEPRTTLKRVAATLAVAALLGWVIWRAWYDARRIDWGSLDIDPGLVALSVVLYGLGFVWHGLVWVVMMRALGYRLGWLPGLRASVLSQLGNYIPGKVFIVLFRAQVATRYGVPALPVAGTTALETLLRNILAALLAALGLYHIGVGASYVPALLVIAAVSVVFAHPRVFHALADWALRTLGRPPLPARLTGPQVALLLVCYLVYWAAQTYAFWLLVRGTLGAEIGDFPALATAMLASQIGSTLAVFAPVGLGAADATLAEVLKLTGGVRAPYVVALVARVWRTVSEMVEIGAVWLIPLPPPESGDAPSAEAGGAQQTPEDGEPVG
ncbi:MAG: lysylphosphatidylglycerol synthase transmembrane domain-containing protein [Armatimonadota bacterium]|nr:lysylphosphatidylglycerol synthase transmembrane domain-containing protein [Armatimonadota bacterium]